MADDRTITCHVDSAQVDKDKILIRGWADTCLPGEDVAFSLTDSQGQSRGLQMTQVLGRTSGMRDCWRPTTPCAAFAYLFPIPRNSTSSLSGTPKHSVSESLSADQVRRDQKRQARRNFISLCLRSLTLHNLAGPSSTSASTASGGSRGTLSPGSAPGASPYGQWYATHHVTEEELAEQRATVLDYQPKISIVVPTWPHPIVFLREMIDSVRAQTYPNWELCIGDGSEGDEGWWTPLAEYAAQDRHQVSGAGEKPGHCRQHQRGPGPGHRRLHRPAGPRRRAPPNTPV